MRAWILKFPWKWTTMIPSFDRNGITRFQSVRLPGRQSAAHRLRLGLRLLGKAFIQPQQGRHDKQDADRRHSGSLQAAGPSFVKPCRKQKQPTRRPAQQPDSARSVSGPPPAALHRYVPPNIDAVPPRRSLLYSQKDYNTRAAEILSPFVYFVSELSRSRRRSTSSSCSDWQESVSRISERASSLAAYIVENRATVREAARRFGISKSTVHKDIQERLPLYTVRPGNRQKSQESPAQMRRALLAIADCTTAAPYPGP